MNIVAEYWDRFQFYIFPRLEIALEEPLFSCLIVSKLAELVNF